MRKLFFSKKAAWSITALFALATVFLAYHAKDFEVDASSDTLLTEDNALFIRTLQANQRYSPDEFILIAFKPVAKPIFEKSTLELVQKIGEEIQAIDRVDAVRSLVNVPIFYGMDSFSSDISPASLSWEQRRYDRDFMEKTLRAHPLYEGLLVNQDQSALSMQVVFKKHETLEKLKRDALSIKSHLLTRKLSDEERRTLTGIQSKMETIETVLEGKRIKEIIRIREILQPHSEEGEFFLGGNNLLAFQLIDIIKNDLMVFGIAIILATIILLYILFRALRWVTLPLLCCFVSIVFTLGLFSLFELKVTVISANVVALQIILTLAVLIHLIVQFQELDDNDNNIGYADLIESTLQKKVKPCFFASLTTSIGFGSLIFSQVQPVISFGWMMVIAMAVTLLTTLVLFPALLLAFCSQKPKRQTYALTSRILTGCANFVVAKPTVVTVGTLALCGVAILGVLRLSAENSFIDYFKSSTDVHRELSFIDADFGGSTSLDVLYKIPESQQKQDVVLTAAAIQSIEAIQAQLAKHEAIGSITSIADFTRVAQVVGKKPLTEYEISALYAAMEPRLRNDLFGAYFSKDQQELRISARIKDSTDGLERSELLKDIHRDIQSLGIDESQYSVTNLFVLYEDILSRLVDSQISTLLIVYLAMAIVLAFVFGSLRLAAIALVPNAVTTLCILGAMGALNIPLDLMTITIASVAMGISVDDTIHYIHRFQSSKRGSEAVLETHLSVGRALLYSSIVIILGFISLVFSDFMPSVYFGFLTALAMALALLSDATVLPALLNKFANSEAKTTSEDSVQSVSS